MNSTKATEVDVRGGRLPVWTQACESPTLVFLHLWGGSHRTFAPVIARLTSGCAAVSYDHRGWGAARDLPGPYGLSDLADDALAVIAGLGISRYVLVGHSMGGKVAQLAAARRPKGLATLALIAPLRRALSLMLRRRRHSLTLSTIARLLAMRSSTC
jgi:pimeloyl-ACP methyl ester carboxylesterase